MLYALVRPVARFVLGYYFRSIDVIGLENIPEEGAVILATNHPTAFLEACMLACYQPRSLHYLARGDLFKNSFYSFLLRGLHILPVFRRQDGGYEKLRENYSTFEACFKTLSRRRAVMILAEGRCIHGKHLLPLKKGTARVALGALEYDTTLTEIYVVPIGVNFVRAENARSQVMIKCGKPMNASDFRESYRNSPATGLRAFTAELRRRLDPLVVQFPGREEAALGEVLLEASRPPEIPDTRNPFRNRSEQLEREIQLAGAKGYDREAVRKLGLLLRRTGVTMGAVAGARQGLKSQEMKGNLLLSAIAGLVLLPWLLPWLLASWIADTYVKTVEFHNPVRFAVVAIATFVLLPVGLLLEPWPLKIWLVVSLLFIRTGIRLWERVARRNEQRVYERTTPQDREALQELYGKVLLVVEKNTK